MHACVRYVIIFVHFASIVYVLVCYDVYCFRVISSAVGFLRRREFCCGALKSPSSYFRNRKIPPCLQTETATNTHMILNGNIGTTSGFNGGLRLNGQDVFVRREADDGTGRVRVGINRAFSTGGGTMEIGGGIRVARGQNTNADDDFGYSFVTQSRTGMFRHASDEHLYFKVNNVDRVAILDPTNRVDVFSNLRVTASEFDLFSLLAFRHVASANGPVLEINPTNSFSGGVRFGSGLVARVGNPTTTGGNGYAFEGNVETGLFLHVSGDPLRVYKDNVIKMSIPSAGAISVTTNFNIEGTTLRLGPSNLGALQADTSSVATCVIALTHESPSHRLISV